MPSLPTILLVDDDLLTLQALEATLKKEGYEILTAHNGQEAISHLQEHSISLIICDQQMPGMSGLEVLQKALSMQPDAIRIALTGIGDLQVIAQLINIGQISQFILKPWDSASLLQTIHTSIEQYRLLKENQRLQELNALQHKQLQENHESLQEELHIGGRIQEVLLMGKPPSTSSGLEIQVSSIPSKEIDGDFFDFYQPCPEVMDLVIGDVMGKGLPAALVGTAVKTQLTRFALPSETAQIYDKSKGWRHQVLNPANILQHLEKEITSSLISLEYFVTLFYGRFYLDKGIFTYIDCGATKPFHYKDSTKTLLTLSGKNFPIGITEKENYQSFDVFIEKGDLLVFYSDGITEARSPNGSLFGVERLGEILSQNAQKPTGEIVQTIKASVANFSQKESFDDDMTLIVIRVLIDHKQLIFNREKNASFISDLSQLQPVRDFVNDLCLKAPGDSKRLADHLQLAINEAFCNIVEHSYLGKATGEIAIRGELTEEGVILDISDRGLSFDPAKIQDPSFIGGSDGGFGLYMIKKASDALSYTKKEKSGWNRLRIMKHYISKEDTMEIVHQTHENVLTIIPKGDNLDAKEAPLFKQKVIDLISDSNNYHVILDLHHLHFIDSSGLGSFLSLLRVVNSHGGDLKIAGMTKPIRTIFELVCMHKIFEIYNTTEEATRSFKS